MHPKVYSMIGISAWYALSISKKMMVPHTRGLQTSQGTKCRVQRLAMGQQTSIWPTASLRTPLSFWLTWLNAARAVLWSKGCTESLKKSLPGFLKNQKWLLLSPEGHRRCLVTWGRGMHLSTVVPCLTSAPHNTWYWGPGSCSILNKEHHGSDPQYKIWSSTWSKENLMKLLYTFGRFKACDLSSQLLWSMLF